MRVHSNLNVDKPAPRGLDRAVRWAIEERARAHWTPERTRAVVGDKDLPVPPREGARLLRALGLLDGDARMPPDRVKKYRQINHMALLLRPAFLALGRPMRVLDAGCGRSYLSLLLAWCGKERWGVPLEVVGVDRNAEVLDECRRRAELAGLGDRASYRAGELGELPDVGPIDAVLALHACDTASCEAIALGVERGVELLFVAPCCQAELAREWARLGRGGDFGGLRGIPHLSREAAAHVTDAMRTLLLRAAGYDATAVELVPSEHAAKNTLIRARRTSAPDPEGLAEYEALKRATGGAGIALERRLRSSAALGLR